MFMCFKKIILLFFLKIYWVFVLDQTGAVMFCGATFKCICFFFFFLLDELNSE